MSEQPGRYQRSASGIVGAMLVLLVVIGAYLALRALNRDELAVEPERVDYREAVRFAQDEGRTVVYPTAVPEAWRPTSIDARDPQGWGIGFLAPEGFVGVRQAEAPVTQLLSTYVDEETESQGPVRLDSEVSDGWESWSDAGGDLAYATELEGGDGVLVYGSAPAADLRVLAEALTTEPLD